MNRLGHTKVAAQFHRDLAAHWKAIVGDNLNILAFAVQADFDHFAPDWPLRGFLFPGKLRRNDLSQNFGAGAARHQASD